LSAIKNPSHQPRKAVLRLRVLPIRLIYARPADAERPCDIGGTHTAWFLFAYPCLPAFAFGDAFRLGRASPCGGVWHSRWICHLGSTGVASISSTGRSSDRFPQSTLAAASHLHRIARTGRLQGEVGAAGASAQPASALPSIATAIVRRKSHLRQGRPLVPALRGLDLHHRPRAQPSFTRGAPCPGFLRLRGSECPVSRRWCARTRMIAAMYYRAPDELAHGHPRCNAFL
jgi:hypothetical protein